MTSRAGMRAGLIVLAVMQGLVGVWAMLGPESFYADFPGAGHAWVALLPEYNEHLTRDVGALSLALTVVLVAAAWWPERRLVRIALVALGVYAIPHTVFHATHLEGFPSADATAQTVGTVLQVALVVALLALSSRLPADRAALPV
jgi:hypothetical protein